VKFMRFKVLYFAFSLVIIIPGLYFLVTSGLKLGIDFTGGALLEYKFEKQQSIEQIREAFNNKEVEIGQISKTTQEYFIIRTKPIDQENLNNLKEDLSNQFGNLDIRREENVGPIIGQETTKKAIIAISLAALAIVMYISFTFRKVPKPASSFRFGITAVLALIHDVLVVVGMFAILGKFFAVEVDTLFVTALLTIIGFSVHDTIVVFDRIRENLLKNIGAKFSTVADISIVQTLSRSLNTSITVIFVLLALLLFGGETLRWFTVALLVGIISGTYSSIFNATALLVWWEEKLGH
jgi:preprotein translocase subunit SecF